MSSGERLAGPTRSRNAIRELEEFLKEHCKKPQRLDRILEIFQYATGHAPIKTMQYIRSIETATGNIKLFMNNLTEHIVWKEHGESPEEIKSKAKLSSKALDFFEKMKIKEEMKEGPCKNLKCPPSSEFECTHCSKYFALIHEEDCES